MAKRPDPFRTRIVAFARMSGGSGASPIASPRRRPHPGGGKASTALTRLRPRGAAFAGVTLLGRRGRILLSGLLGAEDVAAVSPGRHRLPGAGGAQAAFADIVERRLFGVGPGFGGSGGIEIVLGG